jgi:hypothetical protein
MISWIGQVAIMYIERRGYPCSVLNIGGLKACPQYAFVISIGQISWYRKEAFVSRVNPLSPDL